MTSSVIPAFHAFSTRIGGVSAGEFSTLNFGSNRGDDPSAVKENYRRWCALFDTAEDGCCVTRQVHGDVIKIVSSADRHVPMSEIPYEADGLVTARKGLPIFCFTADCVPVILCDEKGKSAGAVHCGWKSSVADILKNTVDAMRELGTEPGDIRVAIGPSIGRCCFETDSDVPEAIGKYLSGDTEGLWDIRGNKFYVDLREANRRRLIQLGLDPEKIDLSEECTVCCHDKYWSARYTARHGLKRGSLSAGIVLR